MFCIFKRKAEAAATLQSYLAAHGGRIFPRIFPLYLPLTYLDKLYGKCTDLYAHAQTVDTRRSSPIFQAPGYEAKLCLALLDFGGIVGSKKNAETSKKHALELHKDTFALSIDNCNSNVCP